MNLLMFLAESAGGAGTEEVSGISMILTYAAPLALMLLLFYFLLIRPERQRSKKAKAMLENLQIADEVVTAGGIIGRIIDVKPDSDTIVIETGGNRTRLRILKSYIVENRTIHDDV